MIEFAVAYPAEATNAYWQRKKSVMDKLAKTTKVTGLGAALTKAETEYKKINFDLLDVGSAPGKEDNPDHLNTPQEIDAAKHKAEQQILTKVRPARQAMRLAAQQAETIAENKDKTFTKTTASAAAAVAKALREREKLLMNIKLTDFDEHKRQKAETARQVLQIFGKGVASAVEYGENFVRTVRETPTPAVFNEDIGKASRKLTQMIGNVNKLKSQGAQLDKEQPQHLYDQLEPWADKGVRLPSTASRETVLEAVTKYENLLNGVRHWWN